MRLTTITLALLIGGCGGGGATSPPLPAQTTEPTAYYAEQAGAFPDLGYMYSFGGMRNGFYTNNIMWATAVPRLPTGHPGIIFSASLAESDPNRPCGGRLYILEYANGRFTDVTASMLVGDPALKGYPSVTAVDDLNGDGITDFVSGVTQDCGRTTASSPNAVVTARPVALISNSQTKQYQLSEFATEDSWENVRILTEADGSKSVALGGYNLRTKPGQEAYKYQLKGSAFEQMANDFPQPNAQGFSIYNTTGTSGYDTLIQPGQQSVLEAYTRTPTGWQITGLASNPYPVIGTSTYTAWNGGVSQIPIINIAGSAVIGAPGRGLIAAQNCTIQIKPNAPKSVLVMLPVNVISNYTAGEPVADSMMDTGRIKPGVRWLSAEIKNGELTTATPQIQGELITDNGGGFTQFDCRDVNGDGYDDLVAYALWPGDKNTNAYPIVYLNQKDGTFKRSSVYKSQTSLQEYQLDSILV
jgi:hypothetical protein